MGLLHNPFRLQLVLAFLVITFQFFILRVYLRITDEGSVPEMCIWSISLIHSDKNVVYIQKRTSTQM